MAATDGALAVATLAVGAAVLLVRELRAAAVLFIAFGLLLALIWARMGAADVALAEAAIGAGLSGALVMDAAKGVRSRADGFAFGAWSCGIGAATLALGAGIAAIALRVNPAAGEALRLVGDALAASEIVHPVTAVLLAFRAWDTMLEIGVLLIAVVAAQAVPAPVRPSVRPDPVLRRVGRPLVAMAVLLAANLLWAGAVRTGGAFQAGAVLAGGLLLTRFVRLSLDSLADAAVRREILALGLLVFVAVGVATTLGGTALAYPPGWTGVLMVTIEAALAVSIAASLIALFGWDRSV